MALLATQREHRAECGLARDSPSGSPWLLPHEVQETLQLDICGFTSRVVTLTGGSNKVH